jgi:hypothetical protein
MKMRCLFFATCWFISFYGVAVEPQVVEPDDEKLLMLDTRVIEQTENARLSLGMPQKDDRNPLLPSDQPWENATNNYYPNVLWDAEEKLWKMWYKDVLADKEVIAQMDAPSTVHDVGWYLLYATSRDGLMWQKPALGLHKFAGSTQNNIVTRDCPNVGVFKDLHDSDASRRYKMVSDVGLGKPRVRFSADGLRWSADETVTGFSGQQGDTHNNAYFDKRLGKYVWFTKMYLGERLVTRLESDDFKTWRSSGVVLRSTLEEGRAHQTYALTVFPYANLWLGYLMMYHVGKDRTVDVELAWSADSVHWQRVKPGTAFLPLGEKGSYDSGCIYAQAGPPVMQDGKLQIYYGGSPTIHLGWKRGASLCRASLREDGFACYEVEDEARPAVITTALLQKGSRPIRIVCDGVVKTDTIPEGKDKLRLRLKLAKGARVYALEGVKLANTSLPKPKLAALPNVKLRDEVVVTFDRDAQGWKSVDQLQHHAEGYIQVSRGRGLRPIALGVPLEGDWPQVLGGEGASISARVRSAKAGGAVRMEIFARDVAQWSYERLPGFTQEWQTLSAELRYDWTDEQARAAGWVPSSHGFSWRETIRNVGKIVVVAAQTGAQETFDLDELRISPR